jgi:hypothetical protein
MVDDGTCTDSVPLADAKVTSKIVNRCSLFVIRIQMLITASLSFPAVIQHRDFFSPCKENGKRTALGHTCIYAADRNRLYYTFKLNSIVSLSPFLPLQGEPKGAQVSEFISIRRDVK